MTADSDATEVLRARHPEVKRLRTLLRDRDVRREESAFVLEGPRAIGGALDRGVPLERLYVSTGASVAFDELVGRARDDGVGVAELAEGVLEKVGRTVTPQPVLAIAPIAAASVTDLADGLVLVGVDVADPGNAGTLIRTGEAVGASGVVFTGTSVDPWNPKAVRASAGAVCGVPVVSTFDTRSALSTLADRGRRIVAAMAGEGTSHFSAVWPPTCAIVLGNEAHGLGAQVDDLIDERVYIPMEGGESLNVAMAGTVLAYSWRHARTGKAQS